QACYWKVCVRDQNGGVSSWSKPARWTMGLLEQSDWKAQWIGAMSAAEAPTTLPAWGKDNIIPDPWFRKTIKLARQPKQAVMYVASIGYHELYVNGKRVGDAVLEPAVTDHSQRARYVTYDIAEYLRPGANTIGLWLGVSWSIYPSYRTSDRPAIPLVMAQAEIDLGGGRHVQVVTDSSWKTRPSPNQLLGAWNFMNFGGELYDANKELANWNEVGLNDASWQAACTYNPKLTLSAEMVEPNRCIREVKPVGVEAVSEGVWRVDMGVNFAGLVEIDVAGKPGQRVDFQFSERADQTITHALRSAYIMGPSGAGTFRNRFNYSVGRWITIKGLASKPEPSAIRGYLVRTAYAPAATFECSDPLLNKIYDMSRWTFENLSLGGYVVDCPHRERMGYGGDAHATIDMALANYQLGALYTKWSQDWRDVQGKSSAWGISNRALPTAGSGDGENPESGNLPYTAPTYWGGGGPGWSGICITLPWRVYQRYGDVRILEENFGTMQRWLRFLESKSVNDMLVRWGGEWDFLGDWLWPGAKGVNGDTPETLFLNNCYWVFNLQTAANVADVLGKRELSAAWRKRAEAVRRAVHAKFFNAADNSYVNGFQAYLAIALLVDVPPQEVRAAVWKRLEDEIRVVRKGHIHAGITGGAFLMRTLLENHRHELIHAMTSQEDFPGWGDMIRKGATTFWESWEGDNSLLHSSYLYIGSWFIDGLGGIEPDAKVAGFKSFVIRPGALAGQGIDWVKAEYQSPYGTIVSQWKVEGEKLRARVRVPANTTARLLLPTREAGTVREGGRMLGKAAGVKQVGFSGSGVELLLEPGDYSFECVR
ncbi:MAG: family 78 glycoside hydrolase catalytic domain, partial [Bacillota bacterium]